MSDAEFDRFARSYRKVHQANIAVTGEEPEYFADYKMRDFSVAVAAVGAPPIGRYLDFGSGVGASVLPFRQHMPQAQLVCADVSAQSLELSRQQHGPECEYLLIESGRLPLPDRSIDGAFACCVFHHIPHEQHGQALAELRRVLRPGAPVMIYEHNPLNPLTVHAVNTCPLDENAVLIGGREMTRRCVAQGFQKARLEYRVFFPAGLKRLRPLEHHLRWLALGAQYAVHATAEQTINVDSSFARFALVGLVNTFVGYGAILLFQLVVGFTAIAANACGYAAGMTLSYALNRRFTFRSQRSHRSGIPAFLAAAAISYGVNLLVLMLFTRHLPAVSPAFAQALAVASYTVSFFLLSRHLVFYRT